MTQNTLNATKFDPSLKHQSGIGELNSLISFFVGVALLGTIHIALFRLNPVPLPTKVSKAFCSMLQLPSTDSRCGDVPVFAIAFWGLPGYPQVSHRYYYSPTPSPYMHRGQIEDIAGAVKLGCTEWSQGWANGYGRPHYQDCYYDLTGNRLTLLLVRYMAIDYDPTRYFEYYSPSGTPLSTPRDPIFFVGDLFGGYGQEAF